MAVCTPIIATEVGSIPDFLFDGKTGLFCKVRDYVSIAEAAAKYVKDKNLYNKVAKQGKELALEKYSWNTIAKKMNIIFQERM